MHHSDIVRGPNFDGWVACQLIGKHDSIPNVHNIEAVDVPAFCIKVPGLNEGSSDLKIKHPFKINPSKAQKQT